MTTAEVPNLVGHSPKFGYLSLIGCCIPHFAAVEKKIKTETTAEALRRFRIIARCQALWRGYVVRRALAEAHENKQQQKRAARNAQEAELQVYPMLSVML